MAAPLCQSRVPLPPRCTPGLPRAPTTSMCAPSLLCSTRSKDGTLLQHTHGASAASGRTAVYLQREGKASAVLTHTGALTLAPCCCCCSSVVAGSACSSMLVMSGQQGWMALTHSCYRLQTEAVTRDPNAIPGYADMTPVQKVRARMRCAQLREASQAQAVTGTRYLPTC